ncbi:MAG: epimerase [bacterium]|nr:epimerase [bacterium]
MKQALVVGGSGPSGPYLLSGLQERGYDVTMFHTGRHEPDGLPEVRHVHGDPYQPDSIAETLGDAEYDVAVATYGRVRHIAAHMAGKTGQFISVSGTPIYKGFITPSVLEPADLPIGVNEGFELVPPDGIPGETYGSAAIRRTEDAVFGLGADGAFAATTFRYPSIYGPRNPHSWEWSAVRRVLDGREFMVLPDGGLPVHSRLSAWNAAHSVLLAIDHSEAAAGEAFNCADDDQFSLAQWCAMAATAAGGELDVVSVPGDIPSPGWATMVFHYSSSRHVVIDTSKIRRLLHYTDAKPARQGLVETVEWQIAHQDQPEWWSVLDPFDYEAEDAFVTAWRTATEALEPHTTRWQDLSMPLPQTASGSS